MPLGNAFPASLKHASIKRQLAPGAVVKIQAVMDDGLIHEKRFVVLHVDSAASTFTCVINTNVPKLIANNSALSKCQVTIDRAAHPFMDWDSHIDCSRVRTYPTDEMCKQLEDKPDWVLGKITPDVRDLIISALKFSPTIPSDIFQICCSSLKSV